MKKLWRAAYGLTIIHLFVSSRGFSFSKKFWHVRVPWNSNTTQKIFFHNKLIENTVHTSLCARACVPDFSKIFMLQQDTPFYSHHHMHNNNAHQSFELQHKTETGTATFPTMNLSSQPYLSAPLLIHRHSCKSMPCLTWLSIAI